ncbi:MAG: chemotaxis protein CheW [Deltaproteobacteria bacterium]|nr:chemotaxis protein CheW [Deltaproteobacteria bacterium]
MEAIAIDETRAGAEVALDEGQLVVFRLGEEEFGVEINRVREIVRLPDITPIPRSPDYVAGICNLRGNVLPIIDTRTRFSMDKREVTDATRLLVVESNGLHAGLIVDGMREVMRMKSAFVEPPPAVTRGLDRAFLSGVVKMNEGKRLILRLNLEEVVRVEAADSADKVAMSAKDVKTGAEAVQAEDQSGDEEQLVTFQVAKEEYAFGIEVVREILRVEAITVVPNVPEYVKGLFTVRNKLIPVLDLRTMLGISSLVSERLAFLDRMIEDHQDWTRTLKNALFSSASFMGVTNLRKSLFGKWSEDYKTSITEVEGILKRLKHDYGILYHRATEVIDLSASGREDAVSLFEKEIEPLAGTITRTFGQLKETIAEKITEDQRVLIVEAGAMQIGFLVDSVSEVLRIPTSTIDDTPYAASSGKKELKGVAKLNEGKRLVMIMDESSLVSQEESEMLSDIRRESEKTNVEEEEISLAQQGLDEEQLVTFSLGNEEYGVRIMKVQEINRLEEITSVPRAPYFVDGVTNLRGNVIPVINVRNLFGLESKERDDRTRIIIVDIAGNKTGLCVDHVNEVLRLPKRDIDETPSIVISGGANRFMEGVCKLNEGKRMVVLINVEKVLNEEDLQALAAVGDQTVETEEKPDAIVGDETVETEEKAETDTGSRIKKKPEIEK